MYSQNGGSETAGAATKYPTQERRTRSKNRLVTKEEMLGDSERKWSNIRKLLDFVNQFQRFDLLSAKEEYDALMRRCGMDSMLEDEDRHFTPISSNRQAKGGNEDYVKQYKTLEKEKVENEQALRMQNETLQMELNRNKTEIEQMKEDMKVLTVELEKNNRRQGDYSRDSSKVEQLVRQNSEMKKKLQETEIMLVKANNDHKEWLETVNAMKTESDKEIHQFRIEIERLRKKEEETRKQLKEEEKKTKAAEAGKSEALTRLSREMGTKLNDNNPAIADLSDPNRATKLAEMYNEIYDNEWTDALEILEKYKDEEICIRILLEIVKNVYKFCKQRAEAEMEFIENGFFAQNMENKRSVVGEADGNKKMILKMLKDYRKTSAENRVEKMYKEYLRTTSDMLSSMVPDYVKKVVQICWLMNVQDPPVVLGQEANAGGSLNTDVYKQYTKTGTLVSYTVWLPLYLHEGGPLLSKGVAQPISSRVRVPAKHEYRTETTPPKERHRKIDKNEAPPMQPKQAWESTYVVSVPGRYGNHENQDYMTDRRYVQETARNFDSRRYETYGKELKPHVFTTGQREFDKTYRPSHYHQSTMTTTRKPLSSWRP